MVRSERILARATASVMLVLVTLLVLSACSRSPLPPASQAPAAEPVPELGGCHVLTPADVAEPSPPAASGVACTEEHTAQTFAIGTLLDATGADRDDPAHGRWIFPRCADAFQRFLGVDESLAMRVQLSWAWFRPSPQAWEDGARWYRCDVVGGTAEATQYRALPETAEGLFSARPPEEWLTCAQGPTVTGSVKVPCSQDHDWRAVTTIKVGGPDEPYPGDRVVQATSRDFCSDSVAGWANYPLDFEYGYTWFGEAEWEAGNRRSVCWAKVS